MWKERGGECSQAVRITREHWWGLELLSTDGWASKEGGLVAHDFTDASFHTSCAYHRQAVA